MKAHLLAAGLLALLLPLGSPGDAATITEIAGFTDTRAVRLEAADFTRLGAACGTGQSVQTDGCSARAVAPLQQRFGRYAGEVDSQDANQIWTISFAQPRSSVQFALSDIMDMRWSTAFRVTAAGVVWETHERRRSGSRTYIEIALDRAVRTLTVALEHFGVERPGSASNDGFGVGVCRGGRI